MEYFHLTATKKRLKKPSSPKPIQEGALVKVNRSWKVEKPLLLYGMACLEGFQDYINHPIKDQRVFSFDW